jgi:hypothetical protein
VERPERGERQLRESSVCASVARHEFRLCLRIFGPLRRNDVLKLILYRLRSLGKVYFCHQAIARFEVNERYDDISPIDCPLKNATETCREESHVKNRSLQVHGKLVVVLVALHDWHRAAPRGPVLIDWYGSYGYGCGRSRTNCRRLVLPQVNRKAIRELNANNPVQVQGLRINVPIWRSDVLKRMNWRFESTNLESATKRSVVLTPESRPGHFASICRHRSAVAKLLRDR